jgi:hypothetical protein
MINPSLMIIANRYESLTASTIIVSDMVNDEELLSGVDGPVTRYNRHIRADGI